MRPSRFTPHSGGTGGGLPFRHEAGHEAIGDGGTNPDFRQHIVGVLVGGLQVDVQIVERGNDHVDDADGPQVTLGVALPVLSRIEIGEHAKQQHREGETGQMQSIEGQWRREEDVAQQHGDTRRDGAPVVEPFGVEPVEEVHPDHHQTGDVKEVEHQLGPRLAQSEVKHAIEHHAHREHTSHGSDHDVEDLGTFLESRLHIIMCFLGRLRLLVGRPSCYDLCD